eukprot:s7108_g1.t1
MRLEDTLLDQGITETAPHISCVVVQLNLWDLWRGVDRSWEGITGVSGRMHRYYCNRMGLPETLQWLTLPCPMPEIGIACLAKQLPDKLTRLIINDDYEDRYALQEMHWPRHLEELILTRTVTNALNRLPLPATLKVLRVYGCTKSRIRGIYWPPCLQELVLRRCLYAGKRGIVRNLSRPEGLRW